MSNFEKMVYHDERGYWYIWPGEEARGPFETRSSAIVEIEFRVNREAAVFDQKLHVGDVVEARFNMLPQLGYWSFRGCILKLNGETARIEALDEVAGWKKGHVFVIPRFLSPLRSETDGIYPL